MRKLKVFSSLLGMGQPVAVKQSPGRVQGRVRFELNRTLTGQGHESFANADQAIGPRPAAELARRLFATGRVANVHMFANIVTVDVANGENSDDLVQVVTDLHQYWQPGMKPPSEQELLARVAVVVPETPSADGGGQELSAAEKLIPPHLLARSRAARAKAQAG